MSLISQLCMVGASCMALTIYLLIYLLKYGVPESVSATYYSELPKWAFSTTLAVAGGFLLIPWIEISEKTEFCAFIATVSVFFVASSPTFKEKFVGKVHYGSAITLFITSVIWLLANDGFWAFLLASLVPAILYRTKWLFWVEIGLFISIYSTLIAFLLAIPR